MQDKTLTNYINLFISLTTTIILIWLFLRALLWPVKYSDFVFNVGFMVFIIEFFTIFTTVIIMEIKKVSQSDLALSLKRKQITKLLFAILIIIGWLILWNTSIERNYSLVLIFVLSFVSKFIGHLTGQKEINQKKELVLPILVLIPVVFVTAITGFVWSAIFPFGPEVWALKPENLQISGSIQGIFVAMIIYYAILQYINLSEFFGWHKDAWFNNMQIRDVPYRR